MSSTIKVASRYVVLAHLQATNAEPVILDEIINVPIPEHILNPQAAIYYANAYFYPEEDVTFHVYTHIYSV